MNPNCPLSAIDRLRLRAAALRKKRDEHGLVFAESVELLKVERTIFLFEEAVKAESRTESRQINHHHRKNPHE